MPCDYSKYPKDWKQTRASILEREGNRCKFCGVENGSVRIDGDRVVAPDSADAFYAAEDWSAGIGPKPSKIVLTVAHLHNPDPMDCRAENLAALCQRCHNRLDMPMRQSNARKTRATKAGQQSLLEVA